MNEVRTMDDDTGIDGGCGNGGDTASVNAPHHVICSASVSPLDILRTRSRTLHPSNNTPLSHVPTSTKLEPGALRIPGNDNVRCWHDGFTFPHAPIGYPVDYDATLGQYTVIGRFCSPQCAAAWASERHQWASNLGTMYLNTVARSIGYETPIIPAPPSFWINEYGGVWDVSVFRQTFCGTCTTPHNTAHPPMISFPAVIEGIGAPPPQPTGKRRVGGPSLSSSNANSSSLCTGMYHAYAEQQNSLKYQSRRASASVTASPNASPALSPMASPMASPTSRSSTTSPTAGSTARSTSSMTSRTTTSRTRGRNASILTSETIAASGESKQRTPEGAKITTQRMADSVIEYPRTKRQNTGSTIESLEPEKEIEGPLSSFVRRRSGRATQKKKSADAPIAMDEE